MKLAKVRKTTAIGADSNGNALYKSKFDSIVDFLLYLDYFNYPKNLESPELLVQFMKSKGYFEEDFNVYLNGVKAFNVILE